MNKSVFSARACIFCGRPPSEKNKEHFVARWLSRFAGNDDSPAEIVDADGYATRRRWSSLTLPACSECNSEYGEFEETAKETFERLSKGYLRASDTQVLLDYMDKLRVSFWLWRLYWCKKQHSINPHFHVNSRLAVSDRVLLVGMYPFDQAKGIAPVGYDTKQFLRCPTVFGIFVKNFFVLSVSSAALISDHFGMTAPVESEFQSAEQVQRKIVGDFRYRPLAPMFRLNGLKFFSFGSQSSSIAKQMSAHVYFDEGTNARRVRGCEAFRIPLITMHRHSAHALAHLNIRELQLDALREYYYMSIPRSELLTTEKCREELLALIRGDHEILDAVHPFILPRKRIFSGIGH